MVLTNLLSVGKQSTRILKEILELFPETAVCSLGFADSIIRQALLKPDCSDPIVPFKQPLLNLLDPGINDFCNIGYFKSPSGKDA